MDGAGALDPLLGGLGDTISSIAIEITTELVTAGNGFLTGERAPDTRDLVDVRRRGARIHRMISGMRTALHRLESDPQMPRALLPIIARHNQRLHALDADVVSAQGQLKLLRDELDLQAAHRTNQNIYFCR